MLLYGIGEKMSGEDAVCTPETASIYRERAGARSAVLLVHGYTGYPGELRSVADALYEAGHSVYAPRLPGHGTTRADFLQTGFFLFGRADGTVQNSAAFKIFATTATA